MKIKQLETVIQDILTELRISPKELVSMSNGYSPDYLGNRSNCKIQLSQVLALKLVEVLEITNINNVESE